MPFELNITYFWLIAAVLLAILEINTTALVCIWFVIGAVAAFAVSFIAESFVTQLVVFAVVSGITLALTRPLALKHLTKSTVPTNADMLIGKVCVVTEPVSPDTKGRVTVDGLSWLAQSDAELNVGDSVRIEKITGATLFVSPNTDKHG